MNSYEQAHREHLNRLERDMWKAVLGGEPVEPDHPETLTEEQIWQKIKGVMPEVDPESTWGYVCHPDFKAKIPRPSLPSPYMAGPPIYADPECRIKDKALVISHQNKKRFLFWREQGYGPYFALHLCLVENKPKTVTPARTASTKNRAKYQKRKNRKARRKK